MSTELLLLLMAIVIGVLLFTVMYIIVTNALNLVLVEKERQWRVACTKAGISQKEIERLYLERRCIRVYKAVMV